MLNTLSYFVQAISAQCVSFFQNFHLVKRVSAFIADLGLRSNFLAKEKVGTFRHHETFRKKPNFSEQLIFFVFPVTEKCGLRILFLYFGVFLALRNW